MSSPPKAARGNFIDIAQRLKEKNAQDTYRGSFYNSSIRSKETGEEVPEEDNSKDGNGTA